MTNLPERIHLVEMAADLGTYAQLTNLKILVPHKSLDLITVEKHFLSQLLKSRISTIYVDEQWYRSKYPDINESIEQGRIKTAKDHYCQFGYFEHRMPYQIEVVEEWYLSQYPDVLASVRREDFASGQHHFETVGYREGRMPVANFSLRRG